MTATAEEEAGAKTPEVDSPLHVLSELASQLVPVLYEVGEKTWPRYRELKHKKWGVIGPEVTVRETLPRRFDVLLRRKNLATMQPCWRLEAGGPVEFFEWDSSGRIHGTYGFRYPVISIAPVAGERRRICGFVVNARPSTTADGVVEAIDARLDSDAFVRSLDGQEVASTVRTAAGRPRVEEARPGMEPTSAYLHTLQMENKTLYFERHGANEYVGAGWTPETIRQAFENPSVRALVIGNPSEPSLTPEPAEH